MKTMSSFENIECQILLRKKRLKLIAIITLFLVLAVCFLLTHRLFESRYTYIDIIDFTQQYVEYPISRGAPILLKVVLAIFAIIIVVSCTAPFSFLHIFAIIPGLLLSWVVLYLVMYVVTFLIAIVVFLIYSLVGNLILALLTLIVGFIMARKASLEIRKLKPKS